WEWPLLFLAGLAYAPHLLRDSLVVPALWVTAVAVALAVLARLRLASGETLVTGPGLLFLALALSVRLDPRMGPLGRVTIDLALPVWFAVRGALGLVQSRANTKIRSSEPSRQGPPRKSP
ncbi:MAG: hypothetical protein KC591_14720, partial [Gemmatimonadetes bacterium]|nr:hypothetical protein [Gemmatimonadota bacterium]